jgi:DNA-binding MarR family transcriptional regulator
MSLYHLKCRNARLDPDSLVNNAFRNPLPRRGVPEGRGGLGKTRDEMIYIIYYDTDFTQREIAEYLGLHYGSVSRIIKSFEKKK